MTWRERLHSLPNGSQPAPPAFRWLFRIFLGVGLFFAVCSFTLITGGFAGLALGLHPDEGTALFTLVGLAANLLMGAMIAAFVRRRSTSRWTPRIAFYGFTAPVFLFLSFLIFSAISQPSQ